MQVSATGNAPVTYRTPQADRAARPELDLGRDAAQNRGANEQATGQTRADQVRAEQAQTAQAVESVGRSNAPEAVVDVIGKGGGGEIRGSRLDISI